MPTFVNRRPVAAPLGRRVLTVPTLVSLTLPLSSLARFGLRDRIKDWLPGKLARHYESFHQGSLGSLRQIPWLMLS